MPSASQLTTSLFQQPIDPGKQAMKGRGSKAQLATAPVDLRQHASALPRLQTLLELDQGRDLEAVLL